MADILAFIPEVINAHFEEAAFLYSEFQAETNASEPNTAYLENVISRIDANLDGLAINAAATCEYCNSAIENEDAGEFFVASYLAFLSGELDKIKPVVEAAQATPYLLQAVASGLAWHPWGRCGFWATKFIAAKQTAMAAIGLYCFNTHKKTVPIKYIDLLARSLSVKASNELPLLLAIGCKNSDTSIVPVLQQNTPEALEPVTFQILQARLKLGDASALSALKPFVLNENDDREAAISLAFSQLEKAQAKQWVAELKSTPQAERFLLLAVAAMHETPLIPWVLKQMEVPELSRIAGKVFSQLSGYDLKQKGWIVENESMDEKWLALEGDEDLDWPDAAKIKQTLNL